MAEIDSKESHNSIDSVASTGENLSIALLKFASKWDSAQQYITDIAVTASMIANLLLDTKKTIDRHGGDWQEDNAMHIVCEGIKDNFEKVARALEKAELKAGPGRFVGRVSNRFTPVTNSGGSDLVEETKRNASLPDQSFLSKRPKGAVLLRAELESNPWVPDRLDEAKDHLQYLYEGFRYLTLRKLQKEDQLQSDEAQELEKLVEQLSTVVAELGNRTRSILESAKRMREVEARKREIQESGMGPVDDPHWRHGINDAMGRRTVDDDIRSIASVDSIASYKFLGIDEVYEAWVIRKFEGEKNWFRRSWSLGWLTVYEYYNDSGYEIDSQAMTIEQMKEQSETVKTGELHPEHVTLIERKLATFPFGVQTQVKYILEDRTRASTNTRYTRKWKIVDIITKPAEAKPLPVWSILFKGQPTFSEVVFIIKGETASPNDVSKPLRDEDPFKKPQYRRRTVYPREMLVDSRPPRQVTEVNRARRGIAAQMVDNRATEAPKLLDPEEAESKIEGILAEIVGVHSEDKETFSSDEVMV